MGEKITRRGCLRALAAGVGLLVLGGCAPKVVEREKDKDEEVSKVPKSREAKPDDGLRKFVREHQPLDVNSFCYCSVLLPGSKVIDVSRLREGSPKSGILPYIADVVSVSESRVEVATNFDDREKKDTKEGTKVYVAQRPDLFRIPSPGAIIVPDYIGKDEFVPNEKSMYENNKENVPGWAAEEFAQVTVSNEFPFEHQLWFKMRLSNGDYTWYRVERQINPRDLEPAFEIFYDDGLFDPVIPTEEQGRAG
ncbi:MAG: hypothetical protein WC686_01780 [Candidatus Shapirobacteria bacterium]|jgi:hypothetical protein